MIKELMLPGYITRIIIDGNGTYYETRYFLNGEVKYALLFDEEIISMK